MTTHSPLSIENIQNRHLRARERREAWISTWQDCYDYTLPQRGNFHGSYQTGAVRTAQIYDGTAMDAADQLAASMLGNLTPPWTQWFGLKPGPALSARDAQALAPVLEKAGKALQTHFDRSNFSVEVHQCFLDLIVGGTASLFFEETAPGNFSAFRFTASPLASIALEEGESGLLDGTFRELSLTLPQLEARYPFADLPEKTRKTGEKDPQVKFSVLESILPTEAGGTLYHALLNEDGMMEELLRLTLPISPVINFRWQKSPGEIYGRSPVMKALPDIKTANKVVELVLKNASISVSGIWQADDDGVLNPSNIELKPGAIIPKAVGSKGLTPLEMPGRFDVSQLVLEDLRRRIRHALLADKLSPISAPRMTATEVLERAAEMALLLGATYGRLQSEFLTPLIQRAYSILRRRGEVPDVLIDGRSVTIDYRSPLARAQAQSGVQNTLSWLASVQAMGPLAAETIDTAAVARYLGDALGVPQDLMKPPLPLEKASDQ
ncbi:MAG: head-tail connector protein [Rhodospirillales bacterium]|nr:head-tail connector protein [Rhodospirillales bacterium]MCB9980080.1 head-tail connector protein [Rhodospirillales bacterium]